jgi:N-acetylmuramoyl-L-alanine amidase
MCYYDGGTLKIAFNERHILTDNSLNGIKIYLDAGHGGDENGADGLGALPEKVITLSITEYLGDYLKNKGAEIVYTREDDSTVSLATRMARIIEEKPDISVSIHCNSMNAWTDFNLYTGTLNLHTYDSPTQLVEKLTEYIEGSTYRKQNLALTRTSICPAVLIETGFISNPGEYEYLSKDENQKEMAEKIGDAIEKYFYNLDGITDSADSSTTSSGKGHSSTSYATKKPTATTEPTAEPVAEPTATPDANIESTPEANVTDGSKVVLNDIENHWAKDYITSAFEKGLVSGYGNGVFKPDNSITRAEFIQILYNVFGNGENGDISFSDVSENEWYYECVKWGVASGLISGYTDNTFGPNKEISREEAAAILSRCESISDGENNIEFKDASDISEWAKNSVNEISKTGIMQGDDNGYFNPKKSLTRAEMTVIANKLL